MSEICHEYNKNFADFEVDFSLKHEREIPSSGTKDLTSAQKTESEN